MKELKDLLFSPVGKFLLTFLGLYVAWFLLYDVWLHPTEIIDRSVVDALIYLSEDLLTLMGYNVFTDGDRWVAIEGTGGLWVGDNCNAVALMALFAGFVIAFPGPWKRKAWFLPLGMTSVFLLNVLRIVILAILDTYSRAWTEFNHTYTFNFLIYGFIFLLWYWWVNKYSGFKISNEDAH